MTDEINQIGKYIKATGKKADLSIKRTFEIEPSQERIRDIFDPTYPFKANINTPKEDTRVYLDVNFGKRLPTLGCCADCVCGVTEAFSSDQAINSSIYTTSPYIAGSVVAYIDGIQATAGVEYSESSPDNKQITILVPFSSAIISYTYATGNCADGTCIDPRLPCLDDSYYIGNAIVFADRFDRNKSPQTAGGCGAWVSYFDDNTGVYTIESMGGEGGTEYVGSVSALVGGLNRNVGRNWEILLAVDRLNHFFGNYSVVATNGFQDVRATFGKPLGGDGTTVEVWLEGAFIDTNEEVREASYGTWGRFRLISHADSPRGVFKEIIPNTPYYVRFIQELSGWTVKWWPQNQEESVSFDSVSVSTANADLALSSTTVDRAYRMAPITINRVATSFTLQAIKVSADNSPGIWGVESGNVDISNYSGGWHGTWCPSNTTGQIRFQFCETPTTTVEKEDNDIPDAQLSWSFSHFDSGLPGIVLRYRESMASWNVIPGRSPGYRVKGYLIAGSYPDVIDYSVKVVTYDLTPGEEPSFHESYGFTGDTAVATYTVPTTGTPVPFEFVLPSDSSKDVLYWGIKIANAADIPGTLPFRSGSFLFPNNHGESVIMKLVEVEALGAIACQANDYCSDCDSTRCLDVVDTFNGTDTAPSERTSYTRNVDYGVPVNIDQYGGTSITYSGNVATFSSTTDDPIYLDYQTTFGCFVGDSSERGQVTFDFRVPTFGLNGGELDVYANNGFSLVYAFYDNTSYGTFYGPSSTYDLPTLAENTWYTAKIEATGDGYNRYKIWQSGTPEPAEWLIEDLDTGGESYNFTNGNLNIIYSAYEAGNGFTVQLRNLNVAGTGSSSNDGGIPPIPPTGGGGGGTEPPPPPTGGIYNLPFEPIQGYGSEALTNSANQVEFHVTTLSPTGPGSIMDGLSASNRKIIFDVAGTIALGTQSVSSLTNFVIDGGGFITLTGKLTLTSCDHFVIRNIRSTGGGTECFYVSASHDFALQHISMSGFTNQSVIIDGGCYNWTKQSCLVTGGPTTTRSSTALGGPGTELRNAYIGVKFGPYFKDTGRIDFINNIISGTGISPQTNGVRAENSTGTQSNMEINVINNFFQEENLAFELWNNPGIFWQEGNGFIYSTDIFPDDTVNTYPSEGRRVTPTWADTDDWAYPTAAQWLIANAGSVPHNTNDYTYMNTVFLIAPPPPPPVDPPSTSNVVEIGQLASKISNAAPGTTLYLRGGQHLSGQININKALGLTNYPSEHPIITHPTGRPDFLYFQGGNNTISNIEFKSGTVGYGDSMGSAMSESDGSNTTLWENCTFTGDPAMTDLQQMLYLRFGNDLTVRGCTFNANGTDGFGVHVYPGSAGEHNIIVENCTFVGFGVSAAITASSKVTIRNCTFINCRNAVQLRDQASGSIIVNNNGTNITTPLDIGGGVTGLTLTNNNW